MAGKPFADKRNTAAWCGASPTSSLPLERLVPARNAAEGASPSRRTPGLETGGVRRPSSRGKVQGITPITPYMRVPPSSAMFLSCQCFSFFLMTFSATNIPRLRKNFITLSLSYLFIA